MSGGSDEYNYALGLKEQICWDVLVSNGVSANISLVSLGKAIQFVLKNKRLLGKNRRVEHELSK